MFLKAWLKQMLWLFSLKNTVGGGTVPSFYTVGDLLDSSLKMWGSHIKAIRWETEKQEAKAAAPDSTMTMSTALLSCSFNEANWSQRMIETIKHTTGESRIQTFY